MNANVVAAILKRNLVSYFSSPLGYVFICVLVLLSAFAAFWPNEFFNANLANLDQLNRFLPWIMLVFVPAVTMSIWAQERAQGTDELLLTMPARDLDIVIGKYLAALVIFTIALLFSLSNVVVLLGLGRPDLGLLAANYAGYWFVGAAMLAVGMAASFLTSNLTIGFILGGALNAPLVFAAYADAIIPQEAGARFVAGLGIAARLGDFARGLITLSGAVFFASVAVVMLYLSMVLIGRRHWSGQVAAVPMWVHYVLRGAALVAVAVGVNVLAQRYDLRVDATAERLSSLSPRTIELVRSLETPRPVFVDAYVSPRVPPEYVQTRLNLLNAIREVDVLGGDRVVVRITPTQAHSREAEEAEQQFGITARQVPATTGGKYSVEEIFLGAAVTCGLDKVVVPFFDRGIPVEYEIVRSIATVGQQERKRLGVLTTDAQLYGGLDFQTMQRRSDQPIIQELQKQYEVVRVNPADPITERYDVLLAVQPSTLPQEQLDNLAAVLRRGQPVAIFEDPFPFLDSAVAPTSEPRRPPGGNNPFMNRQMPEPKGNIGGLWSMLQVEFRDAEVVWDSYNPYPMMPEFPREFVFVGAGSGAPEPFSGASPTTSGLQQMLLVFPGAVRRAGSATLQFTPLLRTGTQTGIVPFDQILTRSFLGPPALNRTRRQLPTGDAYTLAAWIHGPLPAEESPDAEQGDGQAPAAGSELNVVLVADIDVLYPVFFALRARGTEAEGPRFDLDNVTFVLNVLDFLSGDERFIDIRKRRPAHRTLARVEARTEVARARANRESEAAVGEFETAKSREEEALRKRIDELNSRQGIDAKQAIIEITTAQRVGDQRLQAAVEKLERDRDRRLAVVERDLQQETRAIENGYKIMAVALPPIPPLLLGVVVFFRRRALEHVGVPTARLRAA
jgi:ABC-2 type transport system permease protein